MHCHAIKMMREIMIGFKHHAHSNSNKMTQIPKIHASIMFDVWRMYLYFINKQNNLLSIPSVCGWKMNEM